MTWNENTYFDKKNNVANLLVNIILLCIAIGAISLAAGVAFGGFRVLLRRYFPSQTDEAEFISLDLSEPKRHSSGSGTASVERPSKRA